MTNFPQPDQSEVPRLVLVERSEDILSARQGCREAAQNIGLGTLDQTRLATAISELARNALRYGGGGICRIFADETEEASFLRIEMEDHGPGIGDVIAAMEPGYSTGGGYGLGLPAVKKLMDTISIESRPGFTLVAAEMRRRKGL